MELIYLIGVVIAAFALVALFYYSGHEQTRETIRNLSEKITSTINPDHKTKTQIKKDKDKEKEKEKAAAKKAAAPIMKTKPVKLKHQVVSATANKEHRLFFHEIGGHSAQITCLSFSNNGDFVATASIDGNIRCIPVEDIGQPHQHDMYLTIPKHASSLAFTQNSKRLIVASEGDIKFFKLPSKSDSKKLELIKDFASGLQSIHTVQVLDVEKWMTVICAGELDGQPHVRAFNSKGEVLTDLSSKSVEKHHRDKKHPHTNPHLRKSYTQRILLVTSPDDRFIAIAGVGEEVGVGHGDVGIFEVKRCQNGEAAGIELKFEFSGHESEVIGIAWSSNGKKAMTCCADGSWRFWDTSVRFNESDHPRLFSGSQHLPNHIIPHALALVESSFGSTVVLGADTNIYFCNSGSGDVIESVEGAFGGEVTGMKTSADGRLLAFMVNDAKRISVWRAP
eukprot:CAMPEP_0182427454 /NCGR_PEP_ID=MMETSP1167-20130531/17186_1 /TAXON_ID=2988 /ORGANISM="Mallomonas Sp, Strain CCMP3275" /LENGTH=449 /DNA_ID=CAMNT_0024609693 /DNA_START=82 /DNA_END=1431 /DNA_ORIENTATION=-